MEADNAFYACAHAALQQRFAVPPVKTQDLPRSAADDYATAERYPRGQRYVGAHLTFHYDRK